MWFANPAQGIKVWVLATACSDSDKTERETGFPVLPMIVHHKSCLLERAFLSLIYNDIQGQIFSFLFLIPVKQRRYELSMQERAEDL